jgi:hypothetical protein
MARQLEQCRDVERSHVAIVDKTHIPYDLSPQKLERVTPTRRPAIRSPRSPTSLHVRAISSCSTTPSTKSAHSSRGRYATAAFAVNSIQEQFFVFFLKPDADAMVMSAEYARRARDLLILPGGWGSDVPILDGIPFFQRLIAHREVRSVRLLS